MFIYFLELANFEVSYCAFILQGLEGVSNLKVQVVEGIATVEVRELNLFAT